MSSKAGDKKKEVWLIGRRKTWKAGKGNAELKREI